MAINVSQAFHRTSANPVDETMALTKAQMLTVNDNLMPAKYLTVCQDDGYIYLYDKSATPSVTTGKFTKFEGGGGGGGGGTSALYTGTLLASGWSSKTQTVTVTGLAATDNGTVGLLNSATDAQIEAARDAVITVTTVAANAITFKCEETPSVDIPFGVVVGGGSGSAEFPSGGTTGQALVKKSNADNDVEWGTINSIPNGGTTGQALIKHSNTDKDVEWGDVGQIIQVSSMPTASATELGNIYQFVGTTTSTYTNGLFYECVTDGSAYSWEEKAVSKDTQKVVKDNGTAVTDRNTLNFTDFDIADDSTNEETDIKVHRLTAGELAEICSTLPGATTQYPKYSTTEQVVGEWIDGKPIYQKTITPSLPSQKGWVANWVDVSALNIDKMISQKGFFINNNWQADIPEAWGDGTTKEAMSVMKWGFDSSTGYLGINQYTNGTTYTGDLYITLQYTKTTD